jgi:hypothetical protein
MSGHVDEYAGCRLTANHNRGGTLGDDVRRAYARCHVPHASLWLSSGEYGDGARGQDGTTDMRHKYREHGAYVQVAEAGRGKHVT